ncbi:MAG: hypothetical protein U9R50_08015, partial [Campylobacterota bacterium]|nr:hypothetical protein [Campylobacterota bacterium]
EKISTHKNKKQASFEKLPNFEKQSIKEVMAKQDKNKKAQAIKIIGDNAQVSVEAIPINEFIDLIFSEVLKLNYTVTQEIRTLKDPITLNMTQAQKKQQLFDVTQKLLAMHNVQIIKENDLLFISKQDKKKTTSQLETYIGFGRELISNIQDSEDILMFVPYMYATPSNSTNILRMAGISKARFYYPAKNIQMIQGTAGEIRRALKVIKLIDRPYYEDKIFGLVNLDYIDVVDFQTRIKDIFQVNGIPMANTPQEVGLLVKPIKEINTLLVVSPKQSWIEMLMYWKRKLDTQAQIESEQQAYLYMYKVRNRKADELAEALNDILSLEATLTPEPTKTNIKIVPKSSLKEEKKIKQSVSFDLATNTLMLSMLPQEYKTLLPIIEKLDVLPLQTLIEVTIAEVDMTDTFKLGFEWTLRNNGLDVINSLIATGGGSGLGVTFNSANLDATINAYAEDKLLDIVSRPRILVLNNETGNINVGTQVPIISSEASAADIPTASVMRNVSYRTTGVTVGVTPTINSKGILTMKIDLSLSEAQTNDTSDIDSPIIVTRDLSTTSVIRSDETIMIGGLISRNNSETISGIPYLRDIPWIGALFSSSSKKVTKTELIMLIHPVIINSPQEMKEETREFRSILKSIQSI